MLSRTMECKLAVCERAIREGKSYTVAGREAGISPVTARRHFAELRDRLDIKCACGQRAGHRGFCPANPGYVNRKWSRQTVRNKNGLGVSEYIANFAYYRSLFTKDERRMYDEMLAGREGAELIQVQAEAVDVVMRERNCNRDGERPIQ